jgi:hypothetical protein
MLEYPQTFFLLRIRGSALSSIACTPRGKMKSATVPLKKPEIGRTWLRFIRSERLGFRQFGRLNYYEATAGATIHKLDHAADLREKSVVFAAADVGAGFDPRAALAHDNGPAGDQLSAESLYAQPLRIRVAAVSGTS